MATCIDDEGLDEEGAGADTPVIGEDEEEDESGEDDEPPVKRMRMSRMSSDACITAVGMNPLFDLDAGRMSYSASHLSCSSRASSIVSLVE